VPLSGQSRQVKLAFANAMHQLIVMAGEAKLFSQHDT